MATTDVLYGVPDTGLIPLCGDWTGNGMDTIGLYDPTTSVFYLRNSNSSGMADTVFASVQPAAVSRRLSAIGTARARIRRAI